MADYKLIGPDENNGVIRDIDGACIPNAPGNKDWIKYVVWRDAGGVPDPQYTTEEQAQIDYQARQDARIANLKSALINQFKMILALFQVGRDNGVWTVSDFDSELVTIAQQWIALIDEYENDAP